MIFGNNVQTNRLTLFWFFLELDRFAFSGSTNGHTRGGRSVLEYHPCILTGDFNMTPDSPVYNFLQSGQLNYDGLTRLLDFGFGKTLDNFLFPPQLGVTDRCQVFHFLLKTKLFIRCQFSMLKISQLSK
jgi:hypothetical protein